MAGGIINLSPVNDIGALGRILWTSTLSNNESQQGSTLKLYFQVNRGSYSSDFTDNCVVRYVVSNVNSGEIYFGDAEDSTGQAQVEISNVPFSSTFYTVYTLSGFINYSEKNYTPEILIESSILAKKKAIAFTSDENNGVIKLDAYPEEEEEEEEEEVVVVKPTITSASNFNDRGNPKIVYSNPMGNSVEILQACIANSTGGTVYVPYRDISKTGTTYTFNLTDAERTTLCNAANSTNNLAVRFYIRFRINGVYDNRSVPATMTIINANPVLYPIVEDININTTTLTGNSSVIVKGHSTMSFNLTAEPQKGATIKSYSITCGKDTSTNNIGYFEKVENNVFVFSATDSRGNTTTQEVMLDMIDYFKVSCQQEVKMIMNEEDSGNSQVRLTIKGDYFDSSFGAKDNTLALFVRHTQNDGSMGDWVELTPLISEISDGTYLLTTNISGFDVSGSYIFQCKAVDALSEATTSEYTAIFAPVFDWSADDFNFNVPINMNGQQVLRATDTNRLVISASGGDMFLRPNGTDDETGQVRITTDGTIIIDGLTMADFIVEQGTEAMGTNGTWYWTKWKSGKAECYGTRNFGAMSISTAWGSLYLSPAFTQAFPSGLFVSTPECINIQLLDGGNFGAFLLTGHETSPSSSGTGTFQFARAVVGSPSKSDISFHAIGRWK